MFDEDTIISSRAVPPASFELTERPTDLLILEGEVKDMAPRSPHPDYIKIPFCQISVDAVIRIMAEIRKFGAAFAILVFGSVSLGIAGVRWGDPAINGYLEREKAMTAAIARLSANDADREKRDKLMYDLMVSVLAELQRRGER